MPVPAFTTSNGPAARSALVTEVTGTPVPGDSADLLRVRDATPTVEAITGYSYMGCFTDAASPRVLSDEKVELYDFNDPSVCCQWCANQNTDYSYCGVEDKTQCFCGEEENATADSNGRAEESQCDEGCVGNRGVKCGGQGYINIYSATIELGIELTTFQTPTAASVPGYKNIGCVKDSVARLLRQASYTAYTYMDAAYCCAICLNYNNGNVLCGVEAWNECYCDGQNATANIIPTSSTDCSQTCVGHGDQLCGGSYVMNLYSATGVVATSQSLSSVASTTDKSSFSSTTSHTGSSTSTPGPSPSGLHGGAIAGLAIGSVAGVALITGLAYFLWRRSHPSSPSGQAPPPVEISGDAKYGSPDPYQLDGTPVPYQPGAVSPSQAQNVEYYELQAHQAPPQQ